MNVELVLSLKDVPGMLLTALEPISRGGANISSVLHARTSRGVEVTVLFTIKDQKTLDEIIAILKGGKLHVKKVLVEGSKYYSKKSMSFILVGHVIDEDIQHTIDEINSIGLVRNVDISMTDPHAHSSVYFRVDVDENRAKKLKAKINEVASGKKFLIIRGVGN
jgi:ACT domain-containing protein